ncbi:MAG TPA: endonuclease/exonuclease/phosphatase family protein [Patescibacteria group bacterium]|nr:endonuclease/exonuclease/phosphatase family protein [Patescibacteria group bacterium]
MQIKILDLNLFEGGLFWPNIEKLIQKENPDILCLQEVFNGDAKQSPNFRTIEQLDKLLPGFHHYYSPELFEIWPFGQGDGGNAIYSRFPMREEQTIFLHREYQKILRPRNEKDFSHYPKNLQSVVVEIDGKRLHVANMHGIWGLDGKDSKERLQMSKLIVKEVKGKKPLVLAGDFNLKPDTVTIQYIEKLLTNVFKGEMKTSFNMRHKDNLGYASAVVDMFFASPDIKIVSKSVPGDDVSDHLPLLVTVEI